MKTEKGWHESSMVHGELTTVGRMICKKCGEKITDKYYLEINHYNIYHRGNETQWNELFHKKCSPENTEWKNREQEFETKRNEQIAELENEATEFVKSIKKNQDEIRKQVNPFLF